MKNFILYLSLLIPVFTSAQKLTLTGVLVGQHLQIAADTVCIAGADASSVDSITICAKVVNVDSFIFNYLNIMLNCDTLSVCDGGEIVIGYLVDDPECDTLIQIIGINLNSGDGFVSADWWGSAGGAYTLVHDDQGPEECSVPPYTNYYAVATIEKDGGGFCKLVSNTINISP